MPRDHKFDYARAELITSASAMETYIDCPRKWLASKKWRLPEEVKSPTVFGDVTHAVIERFLCADDNGRGPDGQPVDLYPPGWDTLQTKDGPRSVTQHEAALIRLLVDKAIEQGVVRRLPGRRCEVPFQREVCENVSCIGYVDVLYPDGVEDHKTTKSLRYAATPDDLRASVQMLTYAGEVLFRAAEAGRLEDMAEVTLRHNTLVKDADAPIVRPCEVAVTRQQVEDYWERVIIPAAKGMLALARQNILPERWREVRGPPKGEDICGKYGGCPYRRICSGMETPAQHRERVDRINKATAVKTSQEAKKTMGIFDRLRTQQPQPPAPPPKEEAKAPGQPPAPPPPPAVPATKPASGPGVPPWAREGCRACGSNKVKGFNSKGQPCRACDAMQRNENGQTSDQFSIYRDGNHVCWKDQKTGAELGRAEWGPEAQAAPEPPAKQKVADPAAAPAAKVQEAATVAQPPVLPPPPPAPPAAQSEPPAATKAPEKPERGPEMVVKGRPKRGVTLVIGALIKRGPSRRDMVAIAEVIEKYGTLLAREQGAETYYQLDAFKRRDWMAMRVAQIVEDLGTCYVVATVLDPDVRALVNAMEPYCFEVIVGANVG